MTALPGNDGEAGSDEALMEALQQGDDCALTELMRRWELGVKGFLLRLGVPAADVDDVAQESFIRLYEKRANYRVGSAFKPWLLTLAGNLGRNRLRWRFRRREDSFEAMTAVATDEAALMTGSATDAAERLDLVRQVQATIGAMPLKLSQVLLCVEFEGLSHREAAEVLRCSPKAIETRLYRARHFLRSALQSPYKDQ